MIRCNRCGKDDGGRISKHGICERCLMAIIDAYTASLKIKKKEEGQNENERRN